MALEPVKKMGDACVLRHFQKLTNSEEVEEACWGAG